jgi:CRISPR-associated endoribonuclease Cas6
MLDSSGESSTTPLYALHLKLRPLEPGTLMPFSGELVHGAWLNWLRDTAPEVAQRLHDGNQRRLFTCSSLQFPVPTERLLQAQRENIHLPLDVQKSYTIRLTLLLGELYPLLYRIVLGMNMQKGHMGHMKIGKRFFVLEEMISSPDDPSEWTGMTTCEDLVDLARARRFGASFPLELEFASLTTFSRINQASLRYGSHYALLPLPQYLFPGLAKRWQEIAPPALTHIVQPAQIETYVENEGIVIDNYRIQTHHVHFVKHPQRGFIGTCRYLLRGPDEELTDSPLTIRQQLYLLACFSFYTGVGYKPAMGMGQTRLVLNN